MSAYALLALTVESYYTVFLSIGRAMRLMRRAETQGIHKLPICTDNPLLPVNAE